MLDRFGQIEPTVLVAVDGYQYAGKTHDCLVKVAAIARELPTLRRVVIVASQGDQDLSAIHGAASSSSCSSRW